MNGIQNISKVQVQGGFFQFLIIKKTHICKISFFTCIIYFDFKLYHKRQQSINKKKI